MDYELLIAGVSHGIFSTLDGTRHGLSRTHRFVPVRHQEIEIRALRTDAPGVQHLELEALCIEKECRIVNQGIIGSNVKLCLERAGGALGPGAVGDDDAFLLIQFGTNDRQRIFSKYGQPDSVNNFMRNMLTLIDTLARKTDIILMAPGPVADESARKYAFTMVDVRNALNTIARAKRCDLIDHFAAQHGFPLSHILADGLHPNQLGHDLIADNLLGALRSA